MQFQVQAMTEDNSSILFLVSGSTILIAIAVFYIGRSLWIARREWAHCAADTKMLYLLVAPPLTLAVDILEVTDRLFWSRRYAPATPRRPRSQGAASVYRVNSSVRTNA